MTYGAEFDKVDGELALTLEGGHSHARVAHALGDATGQEVMRAMNRRASEADHLDIWPKTFTIDLLTHEGNCRGGSGVESESWADICVGQADHSVYWWRGGVVSRNDKSSDRHSGRSRRCPAGGLQTEDMEFMQFHPTVLYIAGSSRYLISEAVRGEGASRGLQWPSFHAGL